MPPENDKPSRRKADIKLDQIHGGVKAFLSIFDIDIEADPETIRKATIEANKDVRFLRAFRENTNQSIKQARNLTIGGFFAGLGMLIVNYINKHHH